MIIDRPLVNGGGGVNVDIYVYDNNSNDGTSEVAKAAGALVRKETRQGKGNVIRTMFRDIDADCYLMIDGDDTYPAENAREMCELVLNENVDMVIGDRLSSTYFEENKRPFHNMGNSLVRWLINKLFNAHVKDIMTGYRAFSRPFVKHFPVLSKGFEIETEMTIHALDKNFNLREVSVQYRDRPEGSISKLNTYSDGFKVLMTIFKLFRDYKPLIFFGTIALIFILFALGMFVPILVDYAQTGLVPRFPTLFVSVGAFLLGFMFFFCGLVLEVLVKKHRQLFEILMNK
jgi:glycosyltransferase involved in cell wall biosynthesis